MAAEAERPARARFAGVPAMAALPIVVLTPLMLRAGGRPFGLDETLHRWVLERRTPAGATAARWLTGTGVGPTVVVLAILAGVVLAGTGASLGGRVRSVLFALAVVLFGPLLRLLMADLIRRPRPPAADWAASAGGWAFPSGHTTSATVVAVLLAAAFTRPGVRVVIAAWAIGVGLTRVYLGVHWPTDVVGGWSIGLVWAGSALWIRGRSHR